MVGSVPMLKLGDAQKKQGELRRFGVFRVGMEDLDVHGVFPKNKEASPHVRPLYWLSMLFLIHFEKHAVAGFYGFFEVNRVEVAEGGGAFEL